MARRLAATCALALAVVVIPTVALAQDASFEILCNTDGAVIFVDGERVATTPMLEPVYVSEGGHLIRVEKPGFVAYEELVVFFAGDDSLMEIELLPFAGIVRVVTAEAGANVFVDEDLVGRTPYEGEVQIGEHTFRVERTQYEPWSTTTTIAAGEEYFFEAQLIPIPEETEIIIVEETPFYREWWFWTGAAVLVGGAVAAAVVLSGDEEATPVDVLIELPLGQ